MSAVPRRADPARGRGPGAALDYTIYPQAQADGIEGKFKARLTIGANGEVESVTVQKGSEPAFDAAIVAALKRWRFKPAMACGKAVVGHVSPSTRDSSSATSRCDARCP